MTFLFIFCCIGMSFEGFIFLPLPKNYPIILREQKWRKGLDKDINSFMFNRVAHLLKVRHSFLLFNVLSIPFS